MSLISKNLIAFFTNIIFAVFTVILFSFVFMFVSLASIELISVTFNSIFKLSGCFSQIIKSNLLKHVCMDSKHVLFTLLLSRRRRNNNLRLSWLHSYRRLGLLGWRLRLRRLVRGDYNLLDYWLGHDYWGRWLDHDWSHHLSLHHLSLHHLSLLLLLILHIHLLILSLLLMDVLSYLDVSFFRF